MSLVVNIGGVYKDMDKGYVNIGGVWKEIDKIFCNIGGVWKEGYTSEGFAIYKLYYTANSSSTYLDIINPDTGTIIATYTFTYTDLPYDNTGMSRRNNCILCPDGTLYFTVQSKTKIYKLNAAGTLTITSMSIASSYSAIRIDYKNRKLFVANPDGGIKIYNLDTEALIAELAATYGYFPMITYASLNYNGTLFGISASYTDGEDNTSFLKRSYYTNNLSNISPNYRDFIYSDSIEGLYYKVIPVDVDDTMFTQSYRTSSTVRIVNFDGGSTIKTGNAIPSNRYPGDLLEADYDDNYYYTGSMASSVNPMNVYKLNKSDLSIAYTYEIIGADSTAKNINKLRVSEGFLYVDYRITSPTFAHRLRKINLTTNAIVFDVLLSTNQYSSMNCPCTFTWKNNTK